MQHAKMSSSNDTNFSKRTHVSQEGHYTLNHNAGTICNATLDDLLQINVTPSFPGLIALGPTFDERDILIQCCRTLNTKLISANETECLRTAECPVYECAQSDPRALGVKWWMVAAMVLVATGINGV
jgi:hypothetical protein